MQVLTRNQTMQDTIRESFREGSDGFWYPMEKGTPLVRLQFAASGYQIQRRRDVSNPWLPVVTADVAEFDPHAFRLWRERWPAVA